jgi:hypothetical protein
LVGSAGVAGLGGSARLLGLGSAGWSPFAWEDALVKASGSMWFGYGVVLVVTFVVGFLAFVVWVLSKVF